MENYDRNELENFLDRFKALDVILTLSDILDERSRHPRYKEEADSLRFMSANLRSAIFKEGPPKARSHEDVVRSIVKQDGFQEVIGYLRQVALDNMEIYQDDDDPVWQHFKKLARVLNLPSIKSVAKEVENVSIKLD